MIDNLLSNALKFTPPNGSVRVSVSLLRDPVVLKVEDSGVGISAEDQRRLFSRFFRMATAMRQEIQGSGLGLSIVKAIVEGHGGGDHRGARGGQRFDFPDRPAGRRPNRGRVVVILSTARAQESDVERGYEAGADDYITKPFTLKTLQTRVDAALEKSRGNAHS